LNEWLNGPARDFAWDILSSRQALSRAVINNRAALDKLEGESKFGRTIWGLLSLELWQQEFHDQANRYRKQLQHVETASVVVIR
jgi:asparagine synthase (glutamine-hydrolysing)